MCISGIPAIGFGMVAYRQNLRQVVPPILLFRRLIVELLLKKQNPQLEKVFEDAYEYNKKHY